MYTIFGLYRKRKVYLSETLSQAEAFEICREIRKEKGNAWCIYSVPSGRA